MANRSAAVIPAKGIGDALLMMIASHHLLKAGYQVTTFHPQMKELNDWFPGHHFDIIPPTDFAEFDLVIFENDNSQRIQKLLNGSVFYPTYSPEKHGPLFALDQVFNSDLPMVDNIAYAIANLLQLPGISKDNGLSPPAHLSFRQNERRIIIHPCSNDAEKNWPKAKFLSLAYSLKKLGYEPVFVTSLSEKKDWQDVESKGFSLQSFPSLHALAAFLYESGYMIGNDSLLGHLASNMHLPTLIIANDEKRMRLWRPSWRQGMVLTPSRLVPNFKPLRLRKTQWKRWISPTKVLRAFARLSTTL
jgi:hypothetical protein